jgi:hypothetical protein
VMGWLSCQPAARPPCDNISSPIPIAHFVFRFMLFPLVISLCLLEKPRLMRAAVDSYVALANPLMGFTTLYPSYAGCCSPNLRGHNNLAMLAERTPGPYRLMTICAGLETTLPYHTSCKLSISFIHSAKYLLLSSSNFSS